MEIPILFEDNDLLVVNKPPGMVVNRAQSVKEPTVQDWAEHYLGLSSRPTSRDPLFEKTGFRVKPGMTNESTSEEDFYNRAGIVHRLDKETSGVLVIAKNPKAFVAMQQQFKERETQKTYIAIVHGDLTPSEGKIEAPVGRLPWNRERFGILPEGKEAVTEYKKIGNVRHGKSDEILSVVELHPRTGRTHQIRVHMQYIRHALVGDYVYAGRKTSRLDRTWVPRIMLHAKILSFTHPTTQAPLAIEAPIPDDMKRIIE